MRYGNVCTGIGAPEVAWQELGWECQWFSEIEPFPCRLLAHHYPHIPNLGNMLQLHEKKEFLESSIDLLIGGTPCQSFSTAGLRGGLSDARGNLALEFCRILATKRPRWFIWENVPGVFSVEGGRAFRSILTGFSECGYSLAWRVLDAQFFGVPQRRRRVFVVGYFGNDWRPPAAVLFEPEGLRWHPSPGRETGAEITGTLGTRTGGRSIGAEEAGGNMLIAGTIDASYGRLQGCSGQDGGHGHSTLVMALTARPYANNESREANLIVQTGGHGTMASGQPNAEILIDQAPTLNCDHEQPIIFPIAFGSKGMAGDITEDLSPALRAGGHDTSHSNGGVPPAVYFEPRTARNGRGAPDDVAAPLKAESGQTGKGDGAPHIYHGTIIRRLTPLECERLQGFPDNYTNIPGAADSPRYKGLGNSMATPVIKWLGKRIAYYDKIFKC